MEEARLANPLRFLEDGVELIDYLHESTNGIGIAQEYQQRIFGVFQGYTGGMFMRVPVSGWRSVKNC